MSLNVHPLPVVKVLDPRVDLNQRKSYAIVKGGKDISYQQFNATTFSPSQIVITANPPSPQTILSRKMYLQVQFVLSFTGTINAPNTNLLLPGIDAPRAFPLASVTNTVQCSINNDQVSANLNQYIQGLLRYHNCPSKQQSLEYSTTPSMMDQYQQYSDFVDTQSGGSGKNALSGYGEQGPSDQMGGRGGFTYSIANNTLGGGNPAVVTLTVTEPVYLSPFQWDDEDRAGLIGVQNLNLVVTLGNLQRLWSHAVLPAPAVNNVISTLTVSLAGATLLCNYITPDPVEPVPWNMLAWDYFEIIPYPTTYNNNIVVPNNGAQQTTTANNIQFKTIPQKIYIYLERSDQQRDSTLAFAINSTDTFAVINNLSITFDNRVGLLSSSSQQDLYELSRKNGLKLSWPQFSKYVGSVICVEPVDLGMPSTQAAGLIGTFQFSVQVTFSNPAPLAGNNQANNIAYTLKVVAVNEGVMNYVNGSFQHMIGVFSSQDILNAQQLPHVPYKRLKNIYGGDFWSSLRNIGSKVWSGLKSALPYVKKGVELYRNPLSALGMGISVGGVSSGGAKKKAKKHKNCPKSSRCPRAKCLKDSGRGLMLGNDDHYGGGSMIDRSEIKEKLREYLRKK